MSFGYLLTHPDAIIEAVASALLYPVLFVEVFALIAVVVDAGVFTRESWQRRRRVARRELTQGAQTAHSHLKAGKPDDARQALLGLPGGSYSRRFFAALATEADFDTTVLVRLVSETEDAAARRLDKTRMLVRIGPILGLMGTLIPISPALVALAAGKPDVLADNLIVAFSTTVVGLLIGGLAYVMSTVRERWYSGDLRDVEYVLDIATEEA